MVNTEKEMRTNEQVLKWTEYLTAPFVESVAVLDVENGFRVVHANKAMQHLTLYSKDELLCNTLGILTGLKTDVSGIESCHERMRAGKSFTHTIFQYRKDGTAFWNEISFSPLKMEEDGYYYLLLMKDVTSKKNTEQLMQLEREVYADLEKGRNLTDVFEKICHYVTHNFYKKIHCCIFLVDQNTLKVMTEHTVPSEFKKALRDLELAKYLENPVTAKFLSEQVIIDNVQEHPMWAQFKSVTEKYNMKSSWSQPIFNHHGEVVGVISIYFKEIIKPCQADYQFLTELAPIATIALKYIKQKNEIMRLAFVDESTGLHNYAAFEKEIAAIRGPLKKLAFYIIEPSEFYAVVDLFKRNAGDLLLRQIAERLQELPIFKQAIIARFTSSSIIMAVPHVDPEIFRDYLMDFEQEALIIEGKAITITLKVGTSMLQQDEPLELAVQRTDTALNAALKMPGTVMQYFDMHQIQALKEEMEMTQYFLDALKNKEIFAMLQPKVDMKTGEITSFEALARWNSKELGMIAPYKFIAIAEKIGKIYKVDRAILRDVLIWQKQRREQGLKPYPVSVNISADHFYYPLFMDNIKELIAAHDGDPKQIVFEITESIELENVVRAKDIIKQLNEYGISVSIDDFGVGYSSLAYLQELPFEEIKIDKSFTDAIFNPRMKAVLKTIVQLSDNLAMKSVAEGVETEKQHNRLRKMGCHIGQGYYYFRPMTIAAVDTLLSEIL